MNLYYLDKGGCVQAQDPNCLQITDLGDCEKCIQGYYVGPSMAGIVSTQKHNKNIEPATQDKNENPRTLCQPVAVIYQTPNCNFYNNNMYCQECDNLYYLQDNKCHKVDLVIPNCKVHNDGQLCQECQDGYYLTNDFKTCKAFSVNSMCLAFTNRKCSQCYEGSFFVDDNISLINIASKANQSSVIEKVLFSIYKTSKNQMFYGQCMSNTMVGCMKQKDSKTCETCSSGYYLDTDKVCQMNPHGAIDNCQIYSTIDSCAQCVNNFMRVGSADPYLCVAVTAVDKCVTYNGTSTTTECTQCQTGYYAQSSTTCTARTYGSINSCMTYSATADQCSACNTNYQLMSSASGNSCVALGSNCLQIDTGNAYCVRCNNTYMPSSGSKNCSPGSVTNCQIYSSAGSNSYTAVCATCKAGYALVGGACTIVPLISTTSGITVACNSNEAPMMLKSFCKTNSTANCSTYVANTTSCAACLDTFRLKRDTSNAIVATRVCEAISTTLNCKTWDETNNICSVCKDTYILYTEGASNTYGFCVPSWEFTTKNCGTLNTAALGYKFDNNTEPVQTVHENNPCKVCAAGSLPFVSDYNCINTSKITLTSGVGTIFKASDYTPVTNCLRYIPTAQTYAALLCVQCQNGYMLKKPTSGANTCTAMSTLDSETLHLQVFGIPGTTAITNNYTINLLDMGSTNTNNVRLSSYNTQTKYDNGGNIIAASSAQVGVSCRTGKFTVIDTYNYEGTNVDPDTATTTSVFIDDQNRVSPKVACITEAFASEMVKHQTATNATAAYCHYYQDMKGYYDTVTTSLYECMKCPLGKYGLVTTGGTTANQKRKQYNVASIVSNYISACTTFTNCDSSKKVLYGLNLYWTKFFSCYSCQSGGIPVLLMEGIHKDQPVFLNWKRVNLTDATNWTTNIATSVYNQTCIDVSKVSTIVAALKLDLTALTEVKVKPMIGCGLAVLNLIYTRANFSNMSWGSDGTTTVADGNALVCVACLPNQKATFFTAALTIHNESLTTPANSDFNVGKDHFIVNCTPIPNCTSPSNQLVNGCQKCDTGFGFFASGTYGTIDSYQMDRTKCVKLPENNLNCLGYMTRVWNTVTTSWDVAYSALPVNGICVQCNIGYMLNSNGFCDKLVVPGCATGSFVDLKLNYATHKANIAFFVYMSQFGVQKCNACSTGYSLIANKKLIADASALDSANYINFQWQCAQSEFMTFLSKTTNWDTKTNDGKYLDQFTFMCNAYTFEAYANGAKHYQFKYDALNTHAGNLLTNTNVQNYDANTSTKAITTLGAAANRYKCYSCSSGYVLSLYFDYCYPGDLLQNCEIAYDYNDCNQCLTNFVRVVVLDENNPNKFVGQCVKMTVSNCSIVDNINTNNNVIPQCKTCEAGYYKNTTTSRCEPGNVANCQVHASLNECTTCKTNYALYTANTQSHCFPYFGSNMNCTSMTVIPVDGTTVTQLGFACAANTCSNGTYGLSVNTTLATSQYVCAKFSSTSNCSTYSVNSSTALITTYPVCTACITGYYLDNTNKICIARKVSLSNCVDPEPLSDACKSTGCASGYYLTTLKNCLSNPVGTYKCAVYDSAGKVCSACQAGFFLNTGKCEAITSTIANCEEYASATTCSRCTQNSSGFYYVSSNGSSCTLIVIQNCQKPDSTGSKCLECSAGYYASTDQSQCTAATNIIVGCKVQTSESACKSCYNGWVLSLNAASCIYLSDTPFNTCVNETTVQQPICIVCKPGYTMKDGVCTKDVLMEKLQNCLTVDPFDKAKCQLCVPGSFMSTVGQCDTTSITYSTKITNAMQSQIYKSIASKAI